MPWTLIGHGRQDAQPSLVVPAHELLYIAMQVLRGQEVIHVRVTPLAQGSKGLDIVGVDGTHTYSWTRCGFWVRSVSGA